MTPTETLARYDQTIRAVVDRYYRTVRRYGYEWDDLYQEAVLAVLECAYRLDPGRNDHAYVRKTVHNRLIDKFTYSPVTMSVDKKAELRNAQRGDRPSGEIARASADTQPVDPTNEPADDSLTPGQPDPDPDMTALCEYVLRTESFSRDETLLLQHIMHGTPETERLCQKLGCGPTELRRRQARLTRRLSKMLTKAAMKGAK